MITRPADATVLAGESPGVLLYGPNPAASYRTGGVATWMRNLRALVEAAGLGYESLYLDPPWLLRARLPKPFVIAGGALGASFRTFALRRHSGDALLHVNTSLYPRVAYRDGPVVAAGRLAGFPVLLQVHGGRLSYLGRSSPSRALWSRIFATATAIGVYPGPQWKEFEDTAYAPKLRRMYNVVPATSGGSRDHTAKPRILSLASLTDAKGVSGLLEAFIQLREITSEATLTIAGEGPLETVMRKRILEAGVAGAVELPGFLTGRKLAQLMEASNIFVLPSRAEGFPLSFLECAERGMACLVTRNSAIPELFEEGREFIGLDTNDAVGLLDALKRVALNPTLRVAIGRAARAKVQDRYTIAAAAGDYRRLCEDIISLSLPRAP